MENLVPVEATSAETPVVESSTPPVENVSDAPLGDPTAETPAAPAEPVSEDADAEDAPPAGGKPKSRAQERIEDLAQTNKYLREHNEFLREHIAKGGAAPAAKTDPKPPAVEEVPEEAPTLESCDYDVAKLAKKQAEWIKNEVKRGVRDALSTARTTEAAQTQEQVLVKAANEFRKDHPDFDLLISNPKLQWSPTVLGALNEAGEDSPELGYFLANNPDRLAKISQMTPNAAAMALGRIQGDLASKKTTLPAPKVPPAPGKPAAAPAKKPTTTNAPPPPNPISGAASPDVDPMKLSGTEWAALRRQELAEKRKGQNKTVRSF
jgi:hypothetical protein